MVAQRRCRGVFFRRLLLVGVAVAGQLFAEGAEQHVVDERTLSRPAHAGDADEPAERDPESDGEDEGSERELDRRREANEELGEDGTVVDEAVPEVAPQQLAEVGDVLLGDWAVEPEPVLKRDHELRSRVLTEDRGRRIAGQQVDEREQDDRQAEEDRDRAKQPTDDVSQHVTGSSSP